MYVCNVYPENENFSPSQKKTKVASMKKNNCLFGHPIKQTITIGINIENLKQTITIGINIENLHIFIVFFGVKSLYFKKIGLLKLSFLIFDLFYSKEYSNTPHPPF